MGHVDNAKCPQIEVDIRLTLTTPGEAQGPVPVMMEFGFDLGIRPAAGWAARQGDSKAASARRKPR